MTSSLTEQLRARMAMTLTRALDDTGGAPRESLRSEAQTIALVLIAEAMSLPPEPITEEMRALRQTAAAQRELVDTILGEMESWLKHCLHTVSEEEALAKYPNSHAAGWIRLLRKYRPKADCPYETTIPLT